jgi:hypothetical protein
VHAARAHHDQEPIVDSVEDRVDVGAAAQDDRGTRVLQGELVQ